MTHPYALASGTVLNDQTVQQLREDFPLLNTEVNGKRLVYLDSGATSQNPYQVIQTEQSFYQQTNSAVHRGAHTLAVESTELFEQARMVVAGFVGAQENEIVWTANATEALNLITYSFANASSGIGAPASQPFALSEGDEIVLTEQEHHANLIPWQILAQKTGATLRWIPLNADGTLNLEEAERLITERTKVLSFTHVSNVLGCINPVDTLVSLARQVGAFVVLDACQSVPHMPVNFHELDVDFAAFSGHKMLAPTGIGVLYAKAELLANMPPFLTGGSMITKVTMTEAKFMEAPTKFEAGTQKISQAIALAEAVRYLQNIGMDQVYAWEHELGQRLVRGINNLDGVRSLGPEAGQTRAGLVAFDVEGVHPHDVGQLLDMQGIAVRVGHHCAQPLHRALGLTASTRASSYIYNTTEDIDIFLEELAQVRSYFGY
ncbi:cysteine desulfurase [Rothia sp. CCM 9419]|uniref:cysteine desulfurase n=1 Tax=Rothia sp. CCM 9419 TaxID=3402662 RepID=UPI003AEBE36A